MVPMPDSALMNYNKAGVGRPQSEWHFSVGNKLSSWAGFKSCGISSQSVLLSLPNMESISRPQVFIFSSIGMERNACKMVPDVLNVDFKAKGSPSPFCNSVFT